MSRRIAVSEVGSLTRANVPRRYPDVGDTGQLIEPRLGPEGHVTNVALGEISASVWGFPHVNNGGCLRAQRLVTQAVLTPTLAPGASRAGHQLSVLPFGGLHPRNVKGTNWCLLLV